MHGSRHGGHQDRTIRSVRCETVCMGRGHLHVLLGVGPGVGTTRAMLREGRRLRRAGRRVLIGVVEDNGWPDTAALVHGLGSVPRHTVRRNGVVADEMDLDALLRSSPDVALVDDLAHTNAPGSRNAKRWQDVEELRDAGIDVVTTVGIEHIESLTDVVRGITGVVQRETVPDHVVRHTDRVEMVDAPPGDAVRAPLRRTDAPTRGRRSRVVRHLWARQPHRAAGAGPPVARRPRPGRPGGVA